MARRTHIIASLTLGLALSMSGTLAYAATDHYYGRWTVSDEKPVYSSKGILYKTIDVAPCGKDFCGVSVADDHACGEVLFRFLTTHADDEELVGKARWGKVKKKLQLGFGTVENDPPYMYLGLGSDDMDLSGREGSIPTFQADYKRDGDAACTAD
ncbi:hypothetical protein ABIB57_000829 [Devosia sp. UYZn731]|uniref:hypothetical protein n=1 Tax=Devosia sp. UYZn731 TaxID=3156345 RepID=UPI003391C39C